MMKLQLIALLLATCTCSPALAQRTELGDAAKVFEYTLKISGGRATMLQSIDLSAISDPAQRKAIADALANYDEHQFTTRISKEIQANLTEADALECVAFIESKIGWNLLNALRGAATQVEAEQALSKLPPSNRAPITKFINSSCYRKTLEFSTSPTVLEKQRQYGVELICEQYKKALPEEFKRAVKANYCKP